MWDTGSKVEFKDFEMNLGNNVKCFHIALALWIIALVPLREAQGHSSKERCQ